MSIVNPLWKYWIVPAFCLLLAALIAGRHNVRLVNEAMSAPPIKVVQEHVTTPEVLYRNSPPVTVAKFVTTAQEPVKIAGIHLRTWSNYRVEEGESYALLVKQWCAVEVKDYHQVDVHAPKWFSRSRELFDRRNPDLSLSSLPIGAVVQVPCDIAVKKTARAARKHLPNPAL